MMFKKPLVSVIVPVYNVEPYLRRCIDSLIAQKHRPLEVLLVDDASTDGSSFIAQDFSQKYGQIIYLHHQKNSGLSAARNTGIENAKGEWLCFVDSDDWVEPDYISAMLEAAELSRADITVCNYDHVWDNGNIIEVDSIGSISTASNHRLKVALLRNHAVTRLYKRFLFMETGLRFPEDIRRSEDIAISPALLSYAEHIAVLPRPLYHYYQRPGSLSNQNAKLQDYDFINASLARMAQNMKPGFERETQARFIMEILYSKVMLQLTNGHPIRQVRKEVKVFHQAHPDWRQNPYLRYFPTIKRHFILLAGNGKLLIAWAMAKAWAIIKGLKGA